MSDQVVLALIALAGVFIGGMLSMLSLLVSGVMAYYMAKLKTTTDENHKLLNHELVEIKQRIANASHAEGMLAGKAEQRAEDAGTKQGDGQQ